MYGSRLWWDIYGIMMSRDLPSHAKTARGKRFLRDCEPKAVEDPKSVLFIRGTKTSDVLNQAFTDLV